MELSRLTISIITILFAGWNALSLIMAQRREFNALEGIFISYGLGAGLISLEMLGFFFLNLDFSFGKIMTPWLIIFLVNLFLYLKNRNAPHNRPLLAAKRPARALTIFLILGITLEIVYAFFRALIRPIESYDAVAIYAIRSKMIYLANSISRVFFRDLTNLFPHPDYPLNIPLLESFIYSVIGNLNDQLVKIIFPLYFVGILVLVYYAIKRFATNTYSLLFVFILATIPQFNAYAANAYLDLALAYYCFASAVFLFRYFEDIRRRQFLLLSAVMAALAGWTKNEGLMYCVINIILMAVFTIANQKGALKRRALSLLAYSGAIFLISIPWFWIKRTFHIVNNEIDLANLSPLNLMAQSRKIFPIVYEFQKQFFGPKKWNLFWPGLLFVMVLYNRKAFKDAGKYMAISVSLAISGYILFYLISYVDVAYFLSKTWSRFLLHFLPITIYWMAYTLREDLKI